MDYVQLFIIAVSAETRHDLVAGIREYLNHYPAGQRDQGIYALLDRLATERGYTRAHFAVDLTVLLGVSYPEEMIERPGLPVADGEARREAARRELLIAGGRTVREASTEAAALVRAARYHGGSR